MPRLASPGVELFRRLLEAFLPKKEKIDHRRREEKRKKKENKEKSEMAIGVVSKRYEIYGCPLGIDDQSGVLVDRKIYF